MIPRIPLIAWRQYAPWVAFDQIEHDLVLSRAICALYNHPLIQETIAFRGGTALHKMYFPQSGRFSEDLDFVQIKPEPIGAVADAIRDCLDPWLGKPSWKQGQGRFTLYYRFDTEVEPVISRKVKIEINTREHFTLLGYEKRAYGVNNTWFTGDAQVVTFRIEELLGTKLRALYQRKKGRDLFDLWYALTALPDIQPLAIIDSFKHYLAAENKRVSSEEFEKNLLLKCDDPIFNNDILPLLESRQANTYQHASALKKVLEELVSKM